MKPAPWLRGADAAKEDLEQQLEHARAASAKASEATALAREAFDADPSTEPKLRAALETEQGAKLHVERAERLLEQAQKAEAARKRAELEKRRDRLAIELSDQALAAQRRPLADKEADLLIRLAQLRAERRALEIAVRDKAHEFAKIKHALGESMPAYFMDTFPLAPSQTAVRERLQSFIAERPQGDEARRYADRLMDQLIGSLT